MRRFKKRTSGFAVAVIGVIAIGGVLFFVYGRIALRAFNTIGGVVVSLLLAFLYFEQSDILRDQQNFRERLERPVIHVEGHRPGTGEGQYSTRPLELLLSNTGRSSAMDTELELISGFPEGCPLQSGRTTMPLQRDDEESDWNRDWSTYLEDGERKVRYTVEPLMVGWYEEGEFPTEGGPSGHQLGYGMLFGELTKKLEDNRMRLKGAVIYQGPDEFYREEIFDRVVKLSAYGDLGSAVERGTRYRDSLGYPIPSTVPDAGFT